MTYLSNFNNPWDVLVKNMFKDINTFRTLDERIDQPADVYENADGLNIEIACVDVDKQDIRVECQNDILRITYQKSEDSEEIRQYNYRGIRRGSFDLSWKIAQRFDLPNAKVSLDKGILKVTIPEAKESEQLPRILEIQ